MFKNKKFETDIEKAWKKEQEFNEVHFLPQSRIAIALVLIFTCSDFLFLRQLVEFYFTDAEWMVIASALIIATLIDVSPVILAACLLKKPKEKLHYFGIVATSILLVAMFTLIAILRINSSDLIFSTASTQLLSATNAFDTASSSGNAGQTWMSYVFCVIPVFSSILSFLVGIMDQNETRIGYVNRVSANSMHDDISNRCADIHELDWVLQNDLEGMVKQKEKLAMSNADMDRFLIMDRLKIRQAVALGNPQVASNILSRRPSENT